MYFRKDWENGLLEGSTPSLPTKDPLVLSPRSGLRDSGTFTWDPYCGLL